MRQLRVIVLSLVLVMILSTCLASCNGGDPVEITKVDISLGDIYEIGGNAKAVYSSDNEDIAWVDEDGVISAVDVGTANITEISTSSKKVYEVTVSLKEGMVKDAYSKFEDIREQASFIGKSFNVITGTYFDSSDVNLELPVFDTAKLANEKLYRDNVTRYKYQSATGETIDEFSRDYSDQIVGHADASYKKYFSASVDTDFSNMAKNNSSSNVSYERYSTYVETTRLGLSANKKKYRDLLTDGFKADLVNLEPKELINKYGTHIIISAVFGGRVDQNYLLSSDDETNAKENINKISAKLNTEIAGFKADGNLSIDDQIKTDAASKNVSMQMTSTIYGGKALDMRNIDAINKNYTSWLESLNSENVALIGVANKNSLFPIWKLCADDEAGRAKSEAIYNEFMANLGSSYEDIIGGFTINHSIFHGDDATIGVYPQTEANRAVSADLMAGKGTKVGTFDGLDVLEYEKDRYVAYTIGAGNEFGYDEGNTHYFKVEPIEWTRVKDHNNVLSGYRTKKVIDARAYLDVDSLKTGATYDKEENLIKEGDTTVTAYSWRYSTLATFLDNTFYDFAFDEDAKYLDEISTKYAEYVVSDIETTKVEKMARCSVCIVGSGADVPTEATDFAKARGLNAIMNSHVSGYYDVLNPKGNGRDQFIDYMDVTDDYRIYVNETVFIKHPHITGTPSFGTSTVRDINGVVPCISIHR